MTDLAQSDIFFFVTTFAVIAVAIAFIIVVYNVVKVVQEVRMVLRTIEREVNNLVSKRRKVEVFTLTIQKVLGGLVTGGLLRNWGKNKINKWLR